jgi:thiosulfate/3-mercaptopyruvate sulfurtransferase
MESTGTVRVPSLASPQWVASMLGQPDIVILDCSWYLPGTARDADAEYRMAHIPGAIRLDLDLLRNTDNPLPHMLPSAERFADAMEELGVGPQDTVICYDGSGTNLSAARAWWMFRAFGHSKAAVLDGGFATWAEVTRPVQRGAVHRSATGYPVPRLRRELVWDRAQVAAWVDAPGDTQLADCRPAARFAGDVDEPRAGVRRGRVPGSRSAPHSEFTDNATGMMAAPDGLRTVFSKHGLDPARPIVAMCGSGTSACVLALAVEILRESGGVSVGPPVAIYDGSWSEWGAADSPSG